MSKKAFFYVGYTGLEPVTSALSRRHSKPTELIAHKLCDTLSIKYLISFAIGNKTNSIR